MTTDNRFNQLQCIFLGVSLFLLWKFFPVDGALDMYLIRPWMSTSGEFLYKQNWYLDTLSHHYVKNLLIAVYASFLVILIGSFRYTSWRDLRWRYGYMFVMVIISTSIIGVLKSQSEHACPWTMVAPQQNHFSWILNQTDGHCFPGGHSATGFALMVGYFVYRNTDRKKAIFYLYAGVILGFAMGWAQMMRGAHFLSHNLWTGWVIWLSNAVIYGLSYPYLKTRLFERPEQSSKEASGRLVSNTDDADQSGSFDYLLEIQKNK